MRKTGPDRTQAAQWFHALSDETRLHVLSMLVGGERCVCDLQDAVGAAQSRLSFHLKVLRDAGVVDDRRDGRWVYYSIRQEALAGMAAFLGEHEPEGDARDAACACGDGRRRSRVGCG